MSYRKTIGTETEEIIAQVANRNYTKGRQFHDLYIQSKERGNTRLIALMKKFAGELASHGVTLTDFTQIKIDPEYNEGKEGKRIGRCEYCGQSIRKLNRLKYSYTTEDGTVRTGYVPGTGVYVGGIGGAAVGNDCLEHLQDFARSLGDDGFLEMFSKDGRRKIKKSNEEKIEQCLQIPDWLAKALEAKGINPEALKQLPEIFEFGPDLLAGNLDAFQFNVDFANRRNWFNWLRQLYAEDRIGDNEVRTAVGKIETRIHRLTEEEAALLVSYRYQIKDEKAEGLVGGLKKDLKFLEKTEGLNLDIEFDPVLLYTGQDYKPRERRTVKDVLDEIDDQYLTVAEAIGLKIKFPGIEKRRQDRNKEMIRKYFATNEEFDQAVDDLSGLFKEDKEAFREQGRDAETQLPTESYRTLKYFFKLAKKGMSSFRENSIKRIAMPDSERVYKTLFVEWRKKQLADKQEDPLRRKGIMHSAYVAASDFPNVVQIREKIVGSYVPEKGGMDKIEGVGEVTLKRFREMQQELRKPEIEEAVSLGIIPHSIVSGKSSVFGVGEVVKGYVQKTEQENSMLSDVVSLRDIGFEMRNVPDKYIKGGPTKYLEGFDVDEIAAARFVGSWQKRILGNMHRSLVANPKVVKFLENKEEYREKMSKLKSSIQIVLVPDWTGRFVDREVWTRKRENVGSISVLDLDEIDKAISVLDSSVVGKNSDFLKDIVALGFEPVKDWEEKAFSKEALELLTSKHTELKLQQDVDRAVRGMEGYYLDGQKVVTKEVYKGHGWGSATERIGQLQQTLAKISVLPRASPEDMLDPESKPLYRTSDGPFNVYGYTVAEFSRGDETNAFSRKRGGIGLGWDQENGWHLKNLDKRRVDFKLSDLLKRNAQAGTYGRLRIKNT